MKRIIILFAVILGIAAKCEDKGNYLKTSNNDIYFIEPEQKFTWFEAFLDCSNRNLTLLTIENDEKFDDIHQLFGNKEFNGQPPDLWIGGIGSGSKYRWISNRKYITSSLWSVGNPSGGIENCAHILKDTKTLNERNCFDRQGYVCEDIKSKSNNKGINININL